MATANRNSDSPSYMLLNCIAERMHAIGGSLDYDVSQDGHSMTLQVFPGQTWQARSTQTDVRYGHYHALRPNSVAHEIERAEQNFKIWRRLRSERKFQQHE